MLASNTSPKNSILYQPLPKNAYEAARDSIIRLGFVNSAILDDYSFSTQTEKSIKINALAFTHPERRIPITEYAGFTIYNATNGLDDQEIVRVLAYLSAPFHLIHRQDRFSFWASSIRDNHVKPIAIQSDIKYGQLHNALSEYAVDLKPQRIIDVKRGRTQFTHPAFADIVQPLQLSLWSLNVNSQLLVRHFGQAVNILRESLREEETIVELATQLLGAIILADTGGLGKEIRQREDRPELSDLIGLAHHHFPQYFKEPLFFSYPHIADQAYTILSQIRYSGFAPEMLTSIYTAAYGEEQRKELGRYDTPLYLTHRIWENIPVEFLPPEQRVTADMTCGWGSFLLAGYERLSELKDMRGFSLRNYLHGNDSDHLTARLASLGLLISALKDSWHVDAEDALKWDWLDRNRPNIIVGNPPFGADRKTIKRKKNRYQEADRYLARAIECLADGGYLAMVMPQSFIAAQSAPALRKTLLEKFDIKELWDLPLGTFDAATNAVVIFASKKGEKATRNIFPVRVRTLQLNTLKKFKESGLFTASSIASDQSSWSEKPSSIMEYQQILSESTWREIRFRCVSLEKRAFVAMGAIVGDPTKGNWKDYQRPKVVNWLTGADIIPRPFFINYNLAGEITYPNELVRPGKHKRYPDDPTKGKEHLFMGQKVLLISDPNPSWGKRVKVAVEHRGGYYVSNSFYMIKPRINKQYSHITNEVIAAVLDWYVCNAWVVEHLKYPWVEKRIVQNLPFPAQLSRVDCQALNNAVYEIEEATITGLERPLGAVQAIDKVLKSAYQLDNDTFERLRSVAEWDDNPKITLDKQPDPNAQWEISGIVEDVNASQGTITLWLNGFDHFETVPISPVMPGWLLRSKVPFRTTIPRECVRKRSLTDVSWGKFYPQEYTYLSEEEAFEQLTRAFYPET